ncbi:MAG: SGNH/GDSL hydrolase family protein, partial [Gammaproteobacteria bacterium]|nr:SGNH/GDSL hydrolase family protein [Gammaproteobacteria bacterium]
MKSGIRTTFFVLALGIAVPAPADVPWQFTDDTRYMALGDSLAAGYGAQPAIQGYVYPLYQRGVFDRTPSTLFANAGVPGATSADVLQFQVPQAVQRFRPHVVTITVGGNDLLAILNGADPAAVLFQFQNNLAAILASLRAGLPDSDIIVGNLYTIQDIPGAEAVVPVFNQTVAAVSAQFDARVADVYSEFIGRNGLLLIDRNGAGAFEVHPTNAGYRAMADAFEIA